MKAGSAKRRRPSAEMLGRLLQIWWRRHHNSCAEKEGEIRQWWVVWEVNGRVMKKQNGAASSNEDTGRNKGLRLKVFI